MRICVAQTQPITGNIQQNIENHKQLIALAVANEADAIFFSELSLTGYEPTLAIELATDQDDNRFDDFQTISNAHQITIGVGVPTKNSAGVCISMLIFQPHRARQMYSKQYLHADEEPFFVSGQNLSGLVVSNINIALAICYELSVPEHAANAFSSGAPIYVASVAKSVKGIDKACARLSDIARSYAATVLMANSIGWADGDECAGRTSIWNSKGILVGQLNNKSEGILLIDTTTQEVVVKEV